MRTAAWRDDSHGDRDAAGNELTTCRVRRAQEVPTSDPFFVRWPMCRRRFADSLTRVPCAVPSVAGTRCMLRGELAEQTAEGLTTFRVPVHLSGGVRAMLGFLNKFLPQVLGWTLITVAGYSRVPQMINIYDARSAKGLSMASLEIEMMVNTVFVMHNYERSFSDWGEVGVLLIAYVVLMAMVYHYGNSRGRGLIAGAVFVTSMLAWSRDLIPKAIISQLFNLSVVSLAVARGNQVVQNFVNKSVGVASPITLLINVAGTGVRLYTTFVEMPPPALAVRLQYLIAFSLNVVLFGQYWVLGPDRRGKAPPSARGPGARARGAPYGPQDGARMDSSAPQSWERDTVQKKAS